ncbi:MAG: hypothetical protein ACOVRM_02415 [Planctomycetaceae bacterium]
MKQSQDTPKCRGKPDSAPIPAPDTRFVQLAAMLRKINSNHSSFCCQYRVVLLPAPEKGDCAAYSGIGILLAFRAAVLHRAEVIAIPAAGQWRKGKAEHE